ncbi:unnamed protein product [Ambrosiozyma monospora]|uniref:Unnamed protein product n=1 Tax=Ambrosiozyma monospora TaxID=43982 RepID=A0ACB5TAC4_AMBMO|nr:unnamed protein product [Ambrosiozyma monospora]
MLSRAASAIRASRSVLTKQQTQVRYARTRSQVSDLRILLQPKSQQKNNQQYSQQQQNQPKSRPRSRFQPIQPRQKSTRSRIKNNTPETAKTISNDPTLPPELHSKSADQIRDELKQKFAKDGLEYDPEFVDQMITHAQDEADLTKRVLSSETAENEITKEEIVCYMDWLIDDCLSRLPEQHLNDEWRDKEIDKEIALMNSGNSGRGRRGEEVEELLKSAKEGRVSGEAEPSAFGGFDDEALLETKIKHGTMALNELGKQMQNNGLESLPRFLQLVTGTGSNDDLKEYVPLDHCAIMANSIKLLSYLRQD